MDINKSHYSAYEIEGKLEEDMFRELCRDRNYINLTSGRWKENFVNLFGEMLEQMPNPRKVCNRIIRDGLAEKGLPDFDPEQVYFNTFGSAHKEFGEQHYTHEPGSLIASYRLTDACLMNIFAEEYANNWDVLAYDEVAGLYTAGHDQGPWGPNNIVPATALDIYNIIYHNPIQAKYNQAVEEFWAKYKDRYREMLADTFLATAVGQYRSKLLSEYGFALARKFYREAPSVRVRLFDVYTYASTDILLISDSDDHVERTLLYIPGAAVPIQEFVSVDELKAWVRMQLREESKRKAFGKHWALYDRRDGTTSGVDSVLAGIGNGTWDYKVYLLEKNYGLGIAGIFGRLADRTHQRMVSDGDTQIKSDSEAARDYILHLCETLISQLAFIDMLAPEIGIPLNAALSLTAVGLSSDIVLNADTYEEHARGVGSLIGSVLFSAVNLFPVFASFGSVLKNYSREVIPELVTESQCIKARFSVEPHEVLPGGVPIVSTDPELGDVYLVRVTNEEQELAVMRKLTDNKFIRLNPVTLEEVEGQFINKVVNETSGEIRYITGGGLYGGAPYNPFDLDMAGIWTTEELRAEAAVTGRPVGSRYQNIQNTLTKLHESGSFDRKHYYGFSLIELIDEYKTVHPDSGRVTAFDSLRSQIVRALFPEETLALRQTTLKVLAERGAGAASFIYSRGLEGLANQNHALVDSLIRFCEGDMLLSRKISGYYGTLPQPEGWEIKYVINMDHLSELTGDYMSRPVFEGLGFTTNREVLEHVLGRCKANGFDPLYIIQDNTFYLGRRYDELALVISEYSSKAGSALGEEAAVLLDLLREIAGASEEAHPEIEMMRRFGSARFVDKVIETRLHGLENNFLLSENFDFSHWDFGVAGIAGRLDAATETAEEVGLLTAGSGAILEDSAAAYKYVTDNMEAFAGRGVATIAFTAFPYEYASADIAVYMSTGNMSTRLDGIILTLEQGNPDRPIYNLFVKARENNIRILALGGSGSGLLSTGNVYEHLSYGGETMRNAIEQLAGSEEKYIIFSPRRIANTQKGLGFPQPGIAQYLKVPAVEVTAENRLSFIADEAAQRTVMEFPDIRQPLGPMDPSGFFFGLKSYGGADYVFPTAESRAALLVEGLDAETAAAARDAAAAAKEAAAEFTGDPTGNCGLISMQVKTKLELLGHETGPGATVAFWRKIGPGRYDSFNHTATSIMVRGHEFIVDASHLQIRPNEGEPVIVLPLYHWIEEIVNRARAINPWVRRRLMTGTALTIFEPPAYSMPRKPKD